MFSMFRIKILSNFGLMTTIYENFVDTIQFCCNIVRLLLPLTFYAIILVFMAGAH